MFRPYCRYFHDGYHDIPHSEQVYGSWSVVMLRNRSRQTHTGPGRKEILMFFYLYAIIELLAIFLDSGIIPTANVSYPVRIQISCSLGRIVIRESTVVCGDLHGVGGRCIHLSPYQWVCGIPVRGGWHTALALGECSRLQYDRILI